MCMCHTPQPSPSLWAHKALEEYPFCSDLTRLSAFASHLLLASLTLLNRKHNLPLQLITEFRLEEEVHEDNDDVLTFVMDVLFLTFGFMCSCFSEVPLLTWNLSTHSELMCMYIQNTLTKA